MKNETLLLSKKIKTTHYTIDVSKNNEGFDIKTYMNAPSFEQKYYIGMLKLSNELDYIKFKYIMNTHTKTFIFKSREACEIFKTKLLRFMKKYNIEKMCEENEEENI